ncbi:OSCP/delta subunit of ATPase [Schizophyllum amplum]|uniref:ATP synthase subunit 5, mitochondrial n=1 Tax=Schizophyllum amplum TaxID=97359 RepID=A0A550CXV1_9AGAR|nr:OSCP/delta subunit of ATPase [Auriculariopsis ampla]
MLLSAASRSTLVARPLGARCASSAIASKYSQALFGAALTRSADALTKVHSELNTIAKSVQTTPGAAELLSNPTLSSNERAAGLSALFASVEKKSPVSDLTKNFFAVLSDNGRLGETQGVIDSFNTIFAQHNGEVTVTVTSAAPLPQTLQSRLESVLKQSEMAKKAKVLKIENKVNPAIVGGLVVDFGDRTIDLSVQSRVTKLNAALQESV